MNPSTNNCCIKDCKNKVHVVKHQLCHAHYARLLKYGDPEKRKKRRLEPYQPKSE